MGCDILTEDRWRRLMDRRLSFEEEKEIREHFEEDCAECEKFLGEMDHVTEQNLRERFNVSTSVSSIHRSNDWHHDFKSVMRQVQSKAIPHRRWSNPRPVWVSALAGLLILVAVTAIVRDRLTAPQETPKGMPVQSRSVDLEFIVGRQKPDGSLQVSRGIVGGEYSSDQELFFQLQNNLESYIYLLGYQKGGIEFLLPTKVEKVTPFPPGTHEVRIQQRIAGFPLSGLQGRYSVIAIAAEHPLALDEDLIPLIQARMDPLTGLPREGEGPTRDHAVAMDSIYLHVVD